MTSIMQSLIDGYNDLDPRTKNMPLIENPIPLVIIMGSYLYFCLKAGPWMMEGRKPYELKNTILVYNVAQILLSFYLAYQGTIIWSNYDWYCEPIDYSNYNVAKLSWVYFFAKLTELLDTVFFVLRKKYNQVSFLHLFHHTIMPTFTWVGIRYITGGHGTLFGVINSYVHVVMYAYYLIAGLGPQYQKYLWWKKHVTIMQLVQFSIVFVHNFFPLFTECTYPKFIHVMILLFTGFFFYMFSSFYINNYWRSPKNKAKVN